MHRQYAEASFLASMAGDTHRYQITDSCCKISSRSSKPPSIPALLLISVEIPPIHVLPKLTSMHKKPQFPSSQNNSHQIPSNREKAAHLVEHAHQLIARLAYAITVVAVHHENQALGVLEIVAPQGPDLQSSRRAGQLSSN
jgi:hypothetical protein